jgi:uncharacterized protein (TIGR03067 family)
MTTTRSLAMSRRTLPCLACAALSLAFAPAPLPNPDPNKADLKATQGKWTRTLFVLGGSTIRKARGSEITATIKGDLMIYSPGDTWKFTLDARAKPRRIDFKGAVPRLADYLVPGVYRIEGDKLTICSWGVFASKGKRPTSFDSSQPGVWLQVFERVKP